MTPELIKNGYAQKPIAGRRGDNVKLIGECKSVLDSKDGRFGKQESIYQHFGVYQKWKTNMFRSVLLLWAGIMVVAVYAQTRVWSLWEIVICNR